MRSPVYYMGIIMGMFYIAGGIFALILYSKGQVGNYPPWILLGLGILLIVYGAFRIYRFLNSKSQ